MFVNLIKSWLFKREDAKTGYCGGGGEYMSMVPTQKWNIGTSLKALDAFGNCQRPIFSLGVSQHNCIK